MGYKDTHTGLSLHIDGNSRLVPEPRPWIEVMFHAPVASLVSWGSVCQGLALGVIGLQEGVPLWAATNLAPWAKPQSPGTFTPSQAWHQGAAPVTLY